MYVQQLQGIISGAATLATRTRAPFVGTIAIGWTTCDRQGCRRWWSLPNAATTKRQRGQQHPKRAIIRPDGSLRKSLFTGSDEWQRRKYIHGTAISNTNEKAVLVEFVGISGRNFSSGGPFFFSLPPRPTATAVARQFSIWPQKTSHNQRKAWGRFRKT